MILFRKLRRTLLLLLGLAWTTSCGKVGPPVPPEILIPKPVTDLSSAQVGPQIKLTWTLPTQNTNGSTATTLQKIEVYRQIQPRTEAVPSPETVAHTFVGTKIISIDRANLAAFTERGKMVFIDTFPGMNPPSLPQNRYWYALKVKNKKGQDAGYSNWIARQFLSVPPPIPHIDFRAEESAILLSWSSPSMTESAIAGFNVYRGDSIQARPTAPLNEQLLTEPRFEDKNFQFGTTYSYSVRAVVREKTFTAESLDSPLLTFKPVDVFPPKMPTGLTAVFADGKMNLAWDINAESDLAGYHVYRSEDGTSFKKINDALLKSPTFRDEKVGVGKTYSYRVTAVDSSGNESKPSRAVLAAATP